MALRTAAGSLRPGMATVTSLAPVVLTSAPETPSPFTRLFRMLTVSARSDAETWCSVWYTTESPPARARPRRGVHLASTTPTNDPKEMNTTAKMLAKSLRLCVRRFVVVDVWLAFIFRRLRGFALAIAWPARRSRCEEAARQRLTARELELDPAAERFHFGKAGDP